MAGLHREKGGRLSKLRMKEGLKDSVVKWCTREKQTFCALFEARGKPPEERKKCPALFVGSAQPVGRVGRGEEEFCTNKQIYLWPFGRNK